MIVFRKSIMSSILILALIPFAWSYSTNQILNLPLSTELFNGSQACLQILSTSVSRLVLTFLGVVAGWLILFPLGKNLLWVPGRFLVKDFLVHPQKRLHLPHKYGIARSCYL